MSQVPEPAPGPNAAPLDPGHRHPAGGSAQRAALTVAAVAALAVTALPWLPLAAMSAATTSHTASVTGNHVPAASALHRSATMLSHDPVAAAHRDRGQLVTATPLGTLAATATVCTELRKDGFSAASAPYGVRRCQLIYQTVATSGHPTQSG